MKLGFSPIVRRSVQFVTGLVRPCYDAAASDELLYAPGDAGMPVVDDEGNLLTTGGTSRAWASSYQVIAAGASANFTFNESPFKRAHFVVSVKAIGAGATITPLVIGRTVEDWAEGEYTILAPAVIGAVGTFMFAVGPEQTAGANAAKDFLPRRHSVRFAVAGGAAEFKLFINYAT